MSKLKVLVAVCAVLVFSAAASADLLLYEGFDYAPGDLDGQGEATDNWGGAWSTERIENAQVVEDGLTFGSLPTTGGAVRHQGDMIGTWDRYNWSYRPIGEGAAVEGTVWTSYLINVEPYRRYTENGEPVTEPIEELEVSRWAARAGFNPNGDPGARGTGGVGYRATADGDHEGEIALGEWNTQVLSGQPIAVDQTYLVLGRVDGIGGTEETYVEVDGEMVPGYAYTAEMWILDEDDFAALIASGWDEGVLQNNHVQHGTHSVETTELLTFDDDAFVDIHTLDWDSDGFSPIYDELRFGTSLATVAIPEPATLALLGLGGLGLIVRKRR